MPIATDPAVNKSNERLLVADRLHRFFHAGNEETQALRGVSLEIEAGEVVTISGPSGSGKSTLLACLAGLDEPDGGVVTVRGEQLSRRPEHERAEVRARHIGMLFQSNNLLDHLSVEANVILAQRLAKRVDPGRVTRILDELGLLEPNASGELCARTQHALCNGHAAFGRHGEDAIAELEQLGELGVCTGCHRARA